MYLLELVADFGDACVIDADGCVRAVEDSGLLDFFSSLGGGAMDVAGEWRIDAPVAQAD